MFKEINELARQRWEMLKNSPEFKKGQETYREGMKYPKKDYFWVKRYVSKKEWNDFYSQIGAYCFLGENGKEIIVGFLAVGGVPRDSVEIIEEEELRRMDEYRRNKNQRPFPFKESER